MDHPGWTSVDSQAEANAQRIESLAQFVHQLASSVADIADADQWTAMVPGVDDSRRAALRRRVPAWWLDAMDGGSPAMHQVTLLLRTADRQLGELQLQSWKPGGFRQGEIEDARRAAQSMARLLAMIVPPRVTSR